MPTMNTVTSPFGALAVIVDPTAGEGRVAAKRVGCGCPHAMELMRCGRRR